MPSKFVKESISFERGKDPKEVLGIGVMPQVLNIFNNKEIFIEYKNRMYVVKRLWHTTWEVLFIKNYISKHDSHTLEIIGSTKIDSADIDKIIEISKEIIINHEKSLKESMSFERGNDPKKMLGIGKYEKLLNLKRGDIINYESTRTYGLIMNCAQEDFNLFIEYAGFNNYYYAKEAQNLIRTRDIAYRTTKEIMSLEEWYNLIDVVDTGNTNESMSFERGKDPKEVLGISPLTLIKNWMIEIGQKIYPENPIETELARYLLYATSYEKIDFVKYLLSIKVKPVTYALRSAVTRDNIKLVKILLDAGAKYEYSDLYNVSRRMRDFLKAYKSKETNESISFERGKDPKETLGIGEPKLIRISMENHSLHKFLFKNKEYNLRYLFEGWNIYCNGDRIYTNIPGSLEDGSVISNAKLLIIKYANEHYIDESISFERGGDPKEMLGIGDLKHIWDNLKPGNVLIIKKTILTLNYKKGYYIKLGSIHHYGDTAVFIYDIYKNKIKLLKNESFNEYKRWSITFDFFKEYFRVVN